MESVILAIYWEMRKEDDASIIESWGRKVL